MRYIVNINYFYLNLLLYSGSLFTQTKCIVMMTDEGSKIVNFMTPGEWVLVLRCDHISYIVKIYHFYENLLLYSQAQIRQAEVIVMMSEEGSTKIVNYVTPRAGVLVQGCGQKSHIVKLHYLRIFFSSLRHK